MNYMKVDGAPTASKTKCPTKKGICLIPKWKNFCMCMRVLAINGLNGVIRDNSIIIGH